MSRNGGLLLLTLSLVVALLQDVRGLHRCSHEAPTVHQLQYAARAETKSRGKRQANSDFQPLRIKVLYDSTFDNLSEDDRKTIQTGAVEYVMDQFKQLISVRQVSGKLLLQRDCVNGSKAFLNPGGYCSAKGCVTGSACFGLAKVSDEYFAACEVCDDDGNNCSTLGQDGAGVEGADYLLFVSANLAFPKCSLTDPTLAFATACQLERQYDRPVIGFVNICSNKALSSGIEALRSTLFHEISHALVFSPTLFPFYRDEHGHPRTARDPHTGLPLHLGSNLQFVPDANTVAPVAISRTTVPNGTFYYNVTELVTPSLIKEVRSHFDCNSLNGAYLEDLALAGTGGTHFKQRIFGNEIMTGVLDASNVISRLTLALYEDSGWYRSNYSLAQPLRWGQNMGCDFVTSGCLSSSTKTLRRSYCSDLKGLDGFKTARVEGRESTFREFGYNSTCSWDRRSFGVCGLKNSSTDVPSEYQYFKDPHLQGVDPTSDFCPSTYSLVSCTAKRNPDLRINAFSEDYGPQSKCVEIRIDTPWMFANHSITPILGAGCYQVYCIKGQGPIMTVLGKNYSCDGEREIQISHVDIPDALNVLTIVCPPCLDLCWDNIEACDKGPFTHYTPSPFTASPTEPTDDVSTSSESIALYGAGGAVLLIGLLMTCVALAIVCKCCCCKHSGTKRQPNQGYGISASRITEDDDDDFDGDNDEYSDDDDLLSGYDR